MKDPVQIFGVALFAFVLMFMGYQVIAWDLGEQERFERECLAQGGTPINQYSGTRICVAGREIKIP